MLVNVLLLMVMIPVGGVFSLYTPKGKPMEYVRCHKDMKVPLTKVVQCIKKLNPRPVLTYHGCLNRRNIAGTNRRSKHYYGKAIDLNANSPMPASVVDCFEKQGFTWGGRWPLDKIDTMHFQLGE